MLPVLEQVPEGRARRSPILVKEARFGIPEEARLDILGEARLRIPEEARLGILEEALLGTLGEARLGIPEEEVP